MNRKQIIFNYIEGNDFKEIDNKFQDLIQQTIQFASHAYAPYSNFHVSACLILDNGTIIKGTNMENASYPVSICAERTLLSHTVTNYPDEKINTIVIYVDKELGAPVPPCGLCRQTLLEVEERQKSPIKVILISKEGKYIQIEKCSDLLPLSFDGKYL